MGMFDKLAQLKEQPWAQNGNVFHMASASYTGLERTQYGNQHVAECEAGPDAGRTEKFLLYGVMAQQVKRMAPGDLPQEVRIVQDGQANVIKPASEGMPQGYTPNKEEDIPF